MARKTRQQNTADTAAGPMVVAALDHYAPADRRLVDDPLALALLPPGLQRTVRACRFAPLRRLLRWFSEGQTPGVWAGILCRKRFIDAVTTAALAEGVGSVLTLGAGLDSRSCRLVAPAGVVAWEVDMPANVAAKRAAIERALGAVPDGVHPVALDFETGDLAATLRAQGFAFDRPALVIWEGVTQYLEPGAMQATLAALSGLAPGSRLVVTYVLEDFIAGKEMHGAPKLYRRFVEGYAIWKSGLSPASARALLDRFGWDVIEDVGADEHVARYPLSAEDAATLMRIERIAVAVKRV